MKFTFKNHIQYLKTSYQKALDILRVVGHTDWGADRIVLLRLYHSLVCSKLDSETIGLANQGLQITLGAFHTSPAQSLYIEAHEPPIKTVFKLCS